MNNDYYTRLLPYILKFSREFLAHKKIDDTCAALILDGVFRRIVGFSPLDASGFKLKGDEA